MKLPYPSALGAAKFPAVLAFLVTLCSSVAAQSRYVQPVFHGTGQPSPTAPSYTGALLAGGPAAMQGNQFMDVEGNSIVMPASYCQSCPGGYGGAAAGPYGDPMAVDFCTAGPDQCGPHYFDVSLETVVLRPTKLFGEGLPAFSSNGTGRDAGITDDPRLDPRGQGDDYQPGWRIIGRYDIGALALLEVSYAGIYDLGETAVAESSDDQLVSIYSNYGYLEQTIYPDGFVTGLDEASRHTLGYESDLQTTEISYRRYWVGNNPRISGTYLVGARYTRMTEDFTFSAVTPDGNGMLGTFTENDLVGFQFGGDGWLSLRQGLRIGCKGLVGVYNNRFKFNTTIANIAETPLNVQPDTEGNQVACIADGGVSLVADILPNWSLKGGYECLYISSLLTVRGNVNTSIYDSDVTAIPAVGTQGYAFYHGFHGGLEYVW